jgi:3-oxoadipate enol-lactonase
MRARVNDIDMNYTVSGKESAPPVVLHHPLATELSIWDELTAALEPHYRVIRMDARGHGKTDAPAGAYTMSGLARDVVGLMDQLGIKKARYLGLSMGGFVGNVLGYEHPDRFHSLVLVSTSSDMSGARAIWEGRVKTVAVDGMSKPIVEGSMQRWLSPEAFKSKPQLVAWLSKMVAETPPAGFIGWCEAIMNFNVTARLKEIKLPVQIIAGALDPATPPAMMQTMHREISGSEYVEIPGTAHMLQVEEPAKFHAVVVPFMAKHGPAA